MGWFKKNPDLTNNPLYLEPRVTSVEMSLAQIVPKLLGATPIRAVAIGDSTTAGGVKDKTGVVCQVGNSFSFPDKIIGEERAGMQSWFTYACLNSGGRLLLVHNAGVHSDTTNGMLARFQTDAIPYNPHVVFLGDAHNDFSTGSNITEATTRSNIDAMVKLAIANGIIPIIRLIYPDNQTGYQHPIRRHNTWLKQYAMHYGLIVVDTYTPVVDPTSTTGSWVASYTSDGTHASNSGALVAGNRVLSDLSNLLIGDSTKWGRFVATDRVNDVNLLHNPLMQDDINADNKADYWSVGGTPSITTDSAIIGNVQQSVISSGTGIIQYQMNVDGTTVKVGDKLKWSGLVKVSASAGSLNYYLHMSFPGQTTDIYPISQIVGQDFGWTYFECEGIVPSGATILRIQIETVAGTGTIYLAQQSLINMTTLGS